MSSFIQWPAIYGSVYFLPGVLVVVLLLALLLLMSARRRSRAERARLAPDPLPDTAVLEPPAPTETEPDTVHAYAGAPGIVTQPAAMAAEPAMAAAQPVMMAAQPAILAAQPAMTAAQPAAGLAQPAATQSLTLVPPPNGLAPAAAAPLAAAPVLAPIQPLPFETSVVETTRSGRRSRASRGAGDGARVVPIGKNDPMQAAIQDILNGWGDLTPEDMKRLELYRPERLSATLVTVQLPKSGSTDAKLRLSQLRQYASTLEHRAYDAQVSAEAAAAATPETPPISPMTGTAATTATAAANPGPLPIRQTANIFAGYTTPAVSGMPAATQGEPSSASRAVAASEAMTMSRFMTDADTDKPAEPAAVSPLETSKQASPPNDPSAFWADPRPLWEPDPGTSIEELPAPAYHEVEMDPVSKHDLLFGTGAALAASLPAASTPAAPAPLAPPEVEEQPAVRSVYTDADDFFWDDEPHGAVSRLSVKVETAEQLLALPASERVDMVAFLPPAELVATFRASQDPEVKRAVIDTLEHIGSPVSLNALGNCFEDNDSEMQKYALAAADRLLGVA